MMLTISRTLSMVVGRASLASTLALVVFARLRYQSAGSTRSAWDRTTAQLDTLFHHEKCPGVMSLGYDKAREGLAYLFSHMM